MSEREAFLRTIKDNPRDDVAKLVFADWLEERGDLDAAYDQRLAVAMRAIVWAPNDDEPRLRFAEICEKYGRHDRASYIRQAVRRGENWELTGYDSLRDLTKWMMPSESGQEIVESSSPDTNFRYFYGRLGGNAVQWNRGFVAWVRCGLVEWMENGSEVCRFHPVMPHTEMIVDRLPPNMSLCDVDSWDWFFSHYGEIFRRSPHLIEYFDIAKVGVRFATDHEARLWLATQCIEMARSGDL
jgi:uncharacterized protein (TIGR02996 family)